jgi:hydrogenase maturation protease
MKTRIKKLPEESSENRDLDFGFRISDFGFIFIGVGNEFRGDDGVGLLIARRFDEMDIPGITVREENGEGAALMESWKDAGAVFLFDAVSTGNHPPGTVFRFDALKEKIPADFFHYSTHHFSVAEAIELARTLNQLPPCLMVYGVEGVNFTYAKQLTPEVEKAVLEIINLVLLDLDKIRHTTNIPLSAGGYLF